MLPAVETIEAVLCPHRTCGVWISGVPNLDEKGAMYVCPFCRNAFEPRAAENINVYLLKRKS